jgi:prolipoprotein diacylglyceryltransferase
LILYSVYRFGIEFLRGDNQPFALGLTIAQIMSLTLFACGLVAWFNLRARGEIHGAGAEKSK